jgi:hypothetical protein
MAVANQFNLSAIGMVHRVTEMTLAVNAAQRPLMELGGAFVLLGATATQVQAPVAALTTALGALQTNVAGLESALTGMQGITMLTQSLSSLETEAGALQTGIDQGLLPAFDRAYASFFDLADAAVGFQHTVADVVGKMNGAVIAVPSYVGGGAPGAGSGPGAGADNTPEWLKPIEERHPVRDYYDNMKQDATAAAGAASVVTKRMDPEDGAVVTGIATGAGAVHGAYRTYEDHATQQRHDDYRFLPILDLIQKERELRNELQHRHAMEEQLQRAQWNYSHMERTPGMDGQAWVELGQRRWRELEMAQGMIWWSPGDTNEKIGDYQAVLQAEAYVRAHDTPTGPPAFTDDDIYSARILRIPVSSAPAAADAGSPSAGGAAATGGTVGTTSGPAYMRMGMSHTHMPTQRRAVQSLSAALDPFRELETQGRSLLANLQADQRKGNPTGSYLVRLWNMQREVDAFKALHSDPKDPLGARAATLSASLQTAAAPVLREETIGAGSQIDHSRIDAQLARSGQSQEQTNTTPAKPTGIVATLKDAVGSARGFLASAGAEAKDKLGGIMQTFTPMGMLASVFEGVMEGIAPLLDALKEPLRIVGKLIGAGLAPILKAIFPIFKMVAIAATYVAQIFFTVVGGLAKFIGGVIAGIGKLIGKIPGLGGLGKKIKKAGEGIQDMGKGMLESANEMKKGRKEIEKLKFGDTADKVEKLNEQLTNAPEGFKVALERFQAAAPGQATLPGAADSSSDEGDSDTGDESSSAGSAATAAAGKKSKHITIQNVQIVSNNPEEIWKKLKRVMERENNRSNGSLLTPALT